MTLAMRGNNANRRICVKFVRVFQQHLTVDFLAIECLFELFRGPVEVLSMLREDFFTHGVHLLRGSRSSAMVMLLAASCIAGDGTPVRENQARVLKFVLEQSPDLFLKVRHSLPTLESDPFTANIHFSDRVAGGVAGEVSALDLRDMNDDYLHDYRAAADPLVALFQYYLATLELMSAVVYDRYWPGSQHLMEQSFDLACGYNDLLFLIKHELCPWILRAQACNLMAVLYVDRAPFLAVEPFNSIRTWTKLHESVADEKYKKSEPYNFLPENLRPPTGFRELKEHCLTQVCVACQNIFCFCIAWYRRHVLTPYTPVSRSSTSAATSTWMKPARPSSLRSVCEEVGLVCTFPLNYICRFDMCGVYLSAGPTLRCAESRSLAHVSFHRCYVHIGNMDHSRYRPCEAHTK